MPVVPVPEVPEPEVPVPDEPEPQVPLVPEVPEVPDVPELEVPEVPELVLPLELMPDEVRVPMSSLEELRVELQAARLIAIRAPIRTP